MSEQVQRSLRLSFHARYGVIRRVKARRNYRDAVVLPSTRKSPRCMKPERQHQSDACGFDATAMIGAAQKLLRLGGGQFTSIHSNFFAFC